MTWLKYVGSLAATHAILGLIQNVTPILVIYSQTIIESVEEMLEAI